LVSVEMLAVGKELLIGRTVNTNANWLGRRMALMGGMLERVTTVDDELDVISSAAREALARYPDFVIVVGGLGPTPDDMTLKGIAMGTGRKLKTDPKALEMVRRHYADSGRRVPLTKERRKMAVLPAGSSPLPNPVGTAPGVRLESGASVIFCLPGVPSEMKAIFRGSAEQEIAVSMGRLHRAQARLKILGVFESALAPVIARVKAKYPDTYVKSHPRGREEGESRIELDVAAVSADRDEAVSVAAAVAREMGLGVERLGGRVASWRGAGGHRG
jgi:molybdenum cofactor synthesis domain-containing protein